MGRPLPPMSERPHANRHLVSPRYFATLGIPIRAGRDFDERDNSRVPHVVIVNETFARRHFPGEDPDRPHVDHRHGTAAVADCRRRRRRARHESEHAARSGLLPAVAAAAGNVHQHPGAHERQPRGDAAVRARGAAMPWTRICRCCSRKRSPTRDRADGRRSQARAGAAGRVRGPRARCSRAWACTA